MKRSRIIQFPFNKAIVKRGFKTFQNGWILVEMLGSLVVVLAQLFFISVSYFTPRKGNYVQAFGYNAHLALLEKMSGKFPRVILEIFSTFSPLFLQIYVFILTI